MQIGIQAIRRGLLAGALLVAMALPALAETVRIEFDFGASTVDLLGGTIEIPPDGSVDFASAVIDFDAEEGGEIRPGPVSLRSFDLAVTVDAVVLQNAIDGSIDAVQSGTTAGSLNGTLDQIAFEGTLTADVDVDLDCAGPFCGDIASFPILIQDEVVFTDLGGLDVTSLADGPAQVSGQFDIDVGGLQGTLWLSGTETSRIVPEPSFGAWLAVAVVLWRRGAARPAHAGASRPRAAT